jgi:hypothetical protein
MCDKLYYFENYNRRQQKNVDKPFTVCVAIQLPEMDEWCDSFEMPNMEDSLLIREGRDLYDSLFPAKEPSHCLAS